MSDDSNDNDTPSEGESSLGSKIAKGAAIALGAVLAIGLTKWLLGKVIFVGLLGGVGYAGYRLLSKRKALSGNTKKALLPSASKDANEYQAELARFKEENERLDKKLKDLS
jgi:uncharacterized membrane protein YebE (DUF533 family)